MEVRPVRLIPVVLGTDFDKPYISAGFKSNDLGSEVGMVMKTKKDRKYYLNSTGFWISKCEYDSILFRVNVYDYNKGEVGELLHQLPIYVKATPRNKTYADRSAAIQHLCDQRFCHHPGMDTGTA